jgi:hypothetical protein
MLWDLAEGKRLYSLDAGDIINALVFSPNRYWLCAATQVRGGHGGGGSVAEACPRTAARACVRVLQRGRRRCVVGSVSGPRTRARPHAPPRPLHAQQTSIKIWDLESKSVVDDLRPEFSKTYSKKAIEPYAISLAWSADGGTLYAGYTDGVIRVYTVSH